MALPRIDTPKYEFVIPSTGKSVTFRPYTVKEEKVLLIAKESDDQKNMVRAARDLITACSYGKIDPSKLTMFDFEYIFLQIRARSVGEGTEVQIACDSCEKYSPQFIDITNAQVVGEIDRDMKVKITDKVGIVMRWPTFKMAETHLGGKEDTNSMIQALTACIDSIYDENDVYLADETTKKELEEFVDSLSSGQFKSIGEKLNDMPAVSLDVEFKCMSCGEKNNTKIQGLSNFF